MVEQATNTYRAVVTRERDSWVIDIPDVHGARSWAPSLGKVRKYAAEAVSVALDRDVDEGDIEVDVVIDGVSKRQVHRRGPPVGRHRRPGRARGRQGQQGGRRTPRRGRRLRPRDRPLVGLSPSRVQQLLKIG
jgi:hypothetical protein